MSETDEDLVAILLPRRIVQILAQVTMEKLTLEADVAGEELRTAREEIKRQQAMRDSLYQSTSAEIEREETQRHS